MAEMEISDDRKKGGSVEAVDPNEYGLREGAGGEFGWVAGPTLLKFQGYPLEIAREIPRKMSLTPPLLGQK